MMFTIKFSSGPPLPHRRFALAVDKTYLLRGLDVVSLRRGKGYIGSGFQLATLLPDRPSDIDPHDKGFLPLKARASSGESVQEGWTINEQKYAQELLECLLWDPALQHLPRLSLNSVPCMYSMTGLEMAQMIGAILASGGSMVKVLTCDNAGSHNIMKAMLLGLESRPDPG